MPPVIPEGWKPHLRRHLQARYGEGRDYLSAQDFPAGQSVFIRFPDGSHVSFRYAFALTDEARREVAVFTEHCGYHVFPLDDDAELETVQSLPLGR